MTTETETVEDVLAEMREQLTRFTGMPRKKILRYIARIEAAHTREVGELRKDAARIDWLADPNNKIAVVNLPGECILNNPHDARAAIDAAMSPRVEVIR